MDTIGYIKLYREMLKWEWYTDGNTMRVFIHLLLNVRWNDDIVWRGIEIPKGSLIMSYRQIADDLELSLQQVRTAIEKLTYSGEISIKTINALPTHRLTHRATHRSTQRISLITVNNWGKFQSSKGLATHDITHRFDDSVTHRPDSTIQYNIFKEYKEDKEVVTQKVSEVNVNVDGVVSSIIGYLNSKSGKHFKPDRKDTIRLIEKRLSEGFTQDDFFKVIDIKCEQWFDNEKMKKFIRPSTLFGEKFEAYLNEEEDHEPWEDDANELPVF